MMWARSYQGTEEKKMSNEFAEGMAQAAALGGIRTATSLCHKAAVDGGWWTDHLSGDRKERNKGELIALIHSEISEALEGVRKDKMDDHLPHRKSVEVELADALIRIFDFAGAYDLDLGAAMLEKMEYNAKRADHKPENRLKDGGKKF